jgi:hypothetical protein
MPEWLPERPMTKEEFRESVQLSTLLTMGLMNTIGAAHNQEWL